jgi:CDP-diacylglycerol--glycerol-3-phosphate 3-phosphatidyltransferase
MTAPGTGAAPDPIATPPRPRASTWNVANALTALRLLLVPLFGWLLLARGGDDSLLRALAAAVFALAALTDRVDGELARRRGLVTDVGKIADPIADKALMGMALVGLSVLGELPWWVTVVVLVREIGITVLRFVVIRHGVMPAGRGGKAKTALQAVAVTLYLLPLPAAWRPVAMVTMGLAVAVTVLTGLDYVVKAWRLTRTSPRAQARRTMGQPAEEHEAAKDQP